MKTTTPRNVKYWCIIPAAGVGDRMKSKIPKQYLKINHQTILEHTVSLFSTHPLIEQVVVALHSEDTYWSRIQIEHPEKIVTVVGGKTRAESVMHGLRYLQFQAKTLDWILVHDAARPCLPKEVLNRFIDTVGDHRLGGLLALPITDTIKKVDSDHGVRETVARDDLWMAQTPQMFRYGFLFDAMESVLKLEALITDEASAIEAAGEHPLVVQGDWRNIKITTLDDFHRATEILTGK